LKSAQLVNNSNDEAINELKTMGMLQAIFAHNVFPNTVAISHTNQFPTMFCTWGTIQAFSN